MVNSVGNIGGLFASVRDAVIGVENGSIVFVNPAAEEFFGRSLAGALAETVLPEGVLSAEAGTVLTSAKIGGRNFIISSSAFGGLTVFYLSLSDAQKSAGLGERAEYTLRTLLANMKFATDRLRAYLEEHGDDRARAEGAVLDHNCNQIKRLLMNVAAEDAIVRGTMPKVPASTDMEVLCGGVVSTTALFAEKRGISVMFECRAENRSVRIDRDLAEQMLLNLIMNSLLRSAPGGCVSVTLAELGENLVLSVDDTGEAIEAGQLASLFDGPHFRSGNDIVGRDDGMGLSLAKSIAEFFGGSLLIESTAGKTSARVMMHGDRNGSAPLREPAAPYRASGMETVLTQLSPWLKSSDYDMKYKD